MLIFKSISIWYTRTTYGILTAPAEPITHTCTALLTFELKPIGEVLMISVKHYRFCVLFSKAGKSWISLFARPLISSRRLFLIIALLLSQTLQADAPDTLNLCQSCHGQQLEGMSATGAPNLTGQKQEYLQKQLSDFQARVRGSHPQDNFGQQMQAAISMLSPQQITELSAWIADMPMVARQVAGNKPDYTRGKNTFLANCAACHHSSGNGNEALHAPGIVTQDRVYLLRQLNLFRQDIRGNEMSDKSGRQMAMMAKTLADQAALEAVVDYILTLSSE